MRVMVMVKATKTSEAGILPGDPRAPAGWDTLFERMGKFNEELAKAGLLISGDGLKASSHGARIRFGAGKPTVIDGPFAEAKELVAGFWILQAASKDEVISWMKRAPFRDGEIEIRPFFELDDFAASDPTGELRKKEKALFESTRARA